MKLFGWKKDRYDGRDYLYQLRRKAFSPFRILPCDIIVKDQGIVGACVGFTLAENLTQLAILQNAFVEFFSPTWIYNGARFIAGDLLEDIGAEPRDALSWIKNKGCLLEHFWPYDPYNLDKTPPPSKFNVEAAKYPILNYYRITGGYDAICEVIDFNSHYVALGVPWFETWMEIPSSGKLPNVNFTTKIIGGHEVLIYGYDYTNQTLLGINSWGISWGRTGHFELPFQAFDYFRKEGGYDAYYLTVDWKPIANPTNLRVKGEIS